MSKTPECDKMAEVREQSQAIGEFLEWLSCEKSVYLAEDREWEDEEPTSRCVMMDPDDPRYETEMVKRSGTFPFSYQIERLLAEFFEIDLNKVEEERRALLAELRA